MAGRPLPDGLAIVFMPALAALLAQAEHLTRAPLTESQALLVKDAAVAVVAPAATVESRGYPDVNPRGSVGELADPPR